MATSRPGPGLGANIPTFAGGGVLQPRGQSTAQGGIARCDGHKGMIIRDTAKCFNHVAIAPAMNGTGSICLGLERIGRSRSKRFRLTFSK